MTEELHFRELGLADLPQILVIERLSFTLPWSEESYRYELTENQQAHYLGCFQGELLLAYAGFWQVVEEGHIANVAVHPDFRGQGIGELLLRYLILQAQALGLQALTLEVRESNLVAQNLYRKLGFFGAGLRPHYYTDNQEAALVMWCYFDPQAEENQALGGRRRLWQFIEEYRAKKGEG